MSLMRRMTYLGGNDHGQTCSGPGRMVIIRGRGRSQSLLVTRLGQQPSYGAHGCVPCWAYSLLNAAFCWATEAWPAVPE